jgi:hypothetical protein
VSESIIGLLLGFAVGYPLLLVIIGVLLWFGWLNYREARWLLIIGLVGGFIGWLQSSLQHF